MSTCRPDHNLPVWSHAPSPACKRGQPLWRVVYPHAPASVMSGRGRPSPGCVRVLGMGVWAGQPKTHTLSYRTRAPSDENFRYSGDRAGFMAGSFGDPGRACRWKREAAWTPEAATARGKADTSNDNGVTATEFTDYIPQRPIVFEGFLIFQCPHSRLVT